MEVRLDPGRLERARLRRSPTCDQRDRRLHGLDRLELLLPELFRDEAEDADAPGQPGEPLRRLLQEDSDVRPPQKGECEEREASGLRDRLGERGAVADARHRPLHDGVAESVGAGERSVLGEGTQRLRRRQAVPNRVAKSSDEPLRRREAVGERSRECCVLPVGETGQLRSEPRADEHPAPLDEGRLAAVEHPEHVPEPAREPRLGQQRELRVEHDTRGTAGDGGGGGVETDASLGVDRYVERGDEALQKHEHPFVADPATALGSAGDDPVGPARDCFACLRERRHLDEYAAAAPRLERGTCRKQDRRGSGGQVARLDDAGLGEPDAEAVARLSRERPERAIEPGIAGSDLEHAEGSRSAQRGYQPGVAGPAHGDAQNQLSPLSQLRLSAENSSVHDRRGPPPCPE